MGNGNSINHEYVKPFDSYTPDILDVLIDKTVK